MKKLVTAFALCAAISATAVESENIVGYQTKPLSAGFNHLCPTFVQIGGAEQITFNDLLGDFSEGDSVQFVKDDGGTASEYFYLLEGSLAPGATGWYADDFETPAGSTVILSGVSIVYNSVGTATEVSFKGQVNATSVDNSTLPNFNMLGNPFPVNTTLGAITFTGIAEGDSVQFVRSDFGTDSEYFYLLEGSLSPAATGWFADDFETPANDTVIIAGQGFLYNNVGGGAVTVSFASPI